MNALRPEALGVRAQVGVRLDDDFAVDAELDLPAGHTTALLGPNGAGKSTVLASLAGLRPLTSGRIRMGEEVWDDPTEGRFVPPEGRGVGVVFQDRRLFGHLSVLDNVAFPARSRGTSHRESRQGAAEWLGRFDLAHLSARRPADLSGGQAQAVTLCRALASEPRLLLLDEPMSALDVGARVAMRRLLADTLAPLAVPRLLVTHDPVEAFLLADRIHVIEDGRITQVGTPDEIRLQPRTDYAADLAGANLLRGHAAAGSVTVGQHELRIADHGMVGPVLVTVHARAVAVHAERPAGSPRNAWSTTLTRVEEYGDRARLAVETPVPLTVEVTREAVTALGLAPGRDVWLAVKATEIAVTPDE